MLEESRDDLSGYHQAMILMNSAEGNSSLKKKNTIVEFKAQWEQTVEHSHNDELSSQKKNQEVDVIRAETRHGKQAQALILSRTEGREHHRHHSWNMCSNEICKTIS